MGVFFKMFVVECFRESRISITLVKQILSFFRIKQITIQRSLANNFATLMTSLGNLNECMCAADTILASTDFLNNQ